jgi:NACalpha-BTF3-like transcription factor
MRRNALQAIATIWLVLAMTLAAGAAAQDGTPMASPRDTVLGPGGNVYDAVAWVVDQQLEDGAFAGFSGEADAGTTVDAIIALAAARAQGVDTGTAIEDAIAYLASDDVALVYEQTGVGQAAKLVLALVAAGEDPADFVTTNPLAIVENGQDEATGLYGSGIYDHAYALLALAATGSDVPESAIEALAATQIDNGGWAFDASMEADMADSNTTAMVIQALVATGNGDHSAVQSGLEYLLTVLSDNGAGYAQGSEADANSTALVAQAYLATQGDATTLLGALSMYQGPSGAYFYQTADPTDNMFTTLQVIPAVAGQALPVVPEAGATPAASRLVLAA